MIFTIVIPFHDSFKLLILFTKNTIFSLSNIMQEISQKHDKLKHHHTKEARHAK
ncbi:hypothetical protein B4121_2183 [Bacillus paralicheniformis]|uniref:Uncharacterized protein n=1 Tax=Bacillus paralicheniformis TaxID=1648923 RepID=A0A7Z1B4E5_9BACI|nr:hypothetical protein B4121_2183 [Bacillus paralicheniformis]